MREILFKAKRLDNGKWVEGYICKHPTAVQIGESSPWYIHVPPRDPDDNGGLYNVDPSTVCQYTGITDKNGIKVFEGDIVSVKDREEIYKFVVCFGKSGGIRNVAHDVGYIGFYFEGFSKETKKLQKFGLRDDIVYWIEEYDYEVIGNIHDKEEQ